MATFNSFAALERQIMKDMQSAAKRSKDRIEMELFMNVNGYYDGSTPQRYQRTGALLTSPDSTPVQGSGKHLEFSVYMNDGISYSTGTFSGAQVIDATVYCIIKFPKVAEAIPQSCRGNFPNNAAVFGASLSLLGW